MQKMEAGGFEPPSRDASKQASTCLVALLFSSPCQAPKRQAPGSAISVSSRLAGPKNRLSQPA